MKDFNLRMKDSVNEVIDSNNGMLRPDMHEKVTGEKIKIPEVKTTEKAKEWTRTPEFMTENEV
mgnify:CR=1 FL=1